MMALTRMVASSIMTSFILETADPTVLMVGAAAGLLPDIEISTGVIGQMFPSVNGWVEQQHSLKNRFTHSLAGSGLISIIVYTTAYLLGNKFFPLAHAINAGYFFGWFIDVFSKTGVEMFWPDPARYVCPFNPKYRITPGSSAEYILLIILTVAALFTFNIYSDGALVSQFNHLITAASGI